MEAIVALVVLQIRSSWSHDGQVETSPGLSFQNWPAPPLLEPALVCWTETSRRARTVCRWSQMEMRPRTVRVGGARACSLGSRNANSTQSSSSTLFPVFPLSPLEIDVTSLTWGGYTEGAYCCCSLFLLPHSRRRPSRTGGGEYLERREIVLTRRGEKTRRKKRRRNQAGQSLSDPIPPS